MAVLNDRLKKLMNYRIQQEEMSSRIYLAMSVWLDYNGYEGAAKLWRKYSEEERVHVNWAYQHMLDLNEIPQVPDLDSPQIDFSKGGLRQICTMSLMHEKEVTDQCQQLYDAAVEEKEGITIGLALQYLKEQKEELAKTQLWVDKINAFGDDKIAMRLLDNDMGEAAEG